MVVNRLYYGQHDQPTPLNTATHAIGISADTLAEVLQSIYQREFNPKADIEPNLFRAIAGQLTEAVNEGAAPTLGSDPMLHALRHSADVFSAFKTHRTQNDMAALLLDENGNLKPFERWQNDVQPIASHQCRSWLETEYNTAVLRARQAADWQQFEAKKDVLPNLKWLPSTSPNPGADHMPFWNTILPIDHPFWNQHRPGDRWNCKCELTSTAEPPTAAPDVPDGKGSDPQRGLKGNPAKSKEVFSQDHPYFPSDCRHCPFYKPSPIARLRHIFQNHEKNCTGNCPYVDRVIDKIEGFRLEKKFKNGGVLYIHDDVERKKGDFNAILTICRQFAQQGHVVKILPKVHFKSDEYRRLFSQLIGTKYEKKCPDFDTDGLLYEFEGFVKPWNKKKVGRMISHGLIQSSRIVIDNTKGCSDRFIRKQVMARVKLPGQTVDEVWIYEKGKTRLFYKEGTFYKDNGET